MEAGSSLCGRCVCPYLSHGVVCQEGAQPGGVAIINKLAQVEDADAGVYEGHTILAEVTATLRWLMGG